MAADSIVDGEDDKSVDLVYIDESSGRAVICQNYMADAKKPEAPSTKAAWLAQGVQWLLGVEIDTVPPRIASVARLLRKAIVDGTITAIDIWYVHNCGESKNVQLELRAVEETTDSIVKSKFPETSIEITSREIGVNALADLYQGTQVAIEVTDHFEIEVTGIFSTEGEDWTAVCASIPGSWLVEQFKKHNVALFSANVRADTWVQNALIEISIMELRKLRETLPAISGCSTMELPPSSMTFRLSLQKKAARPSTVCSSMVLQ